jgi:hypothetical protein
LSSERLVDIKITKFYVEKADVKLKKCNVNKVNEELLKEKNRWLYQPINPERIHEFIEKVARLVKKHSPTVKLNLYKNQLPP